MTKQNRKDFIEQMPIPKAVMSMSVPTVTSSLVMVIYSLWHGKVSGGIAELVYQVYTQRKDIKIT